MMSTEDQYYAIEAPKVREKVREFKAEIGIWGKVDRWRYLLDVLIGLEQSIAISYIRYQKEVSTRGKFLDRALIGAGILDMESELDRVSREMLALEDAFQGKKRKSEITDEMIDRAREYPISELISVRHGLALCPFHLERHPSMGVKHNRFHCFACGAKGDVIEFIMKRDDLTFIQAVKQLS